MNELTSSQRTALAHATTQAASKRTQARQTIEHICRMCNVVAPAYEGAVVALKQHARVALQFHPDRPDSRRQTVAAGLLASGIYKNQFETLVSNGSLSAFTGGERQLWETRLFGGAYDLESSTHEQRPKYGALDLLLHSDGPSPRFGSCYFLLKPAVSHRCTFTYLDSHQAPNQAGTFAELDDILAALLMDTFRGDSALGERDLTVPRLIQHLAANLQHSASVPRNLAPARNLNHYIEAQVHGDIRLERDVDLLIADPSFHATSVGTELQKIAASYNLALRWHAGFRLRVAEVPSDFRGPTMPSLAARIAAEGCIDASVLGSAAMDLRARPEAWSDRGSYSEVLQELKLLWHILVRYGNPIADWRR
jgi:hypothetical protein